MHSVIANKSTDSIRTMLPSTACNITCDTDIKGAITLAGEDVDARTLLTHSAALGPRFRGDDENLSSLPSEDTEARWVRHTPITQPGTSRRSSGLRWQRCLTSA